MTVYKVFLYWTTPIYFTMLGIMNHRKPLLTVTSLIFLNNPASPKMFLASNIINKINNYFHIC